ncbi:MAG TPA: hypothetical protein VNT75_09615 [Symbiobacteriaceae bacterium]|nr:hypothetical protein [Symbiobacteriaceae bacterium]
MSSGGTLVKALRLIASASAALLAVALVALLFAPRDPGTLTLYALVIGVNLIVLLLFWPTARWLQRFTR